MTVTDLTNSYLTHTSAQSYVTPPKLRACFVVGMYLPDRWEVEPHLVLETSPGRYQCSWAIEPTQDYSACENVSKRLAARYGGDASAADVTHVFRLGGFVHQKGKPFTSRIVKAVDPATVKVGGFDRLILEHFGFLPELEQRSESLSTRASGGLDAANASLLLEHLEARLFNTARVAASYSAHRSWSCASCSGLSFAGDGVILGLWGWYRSQRTCTQLVRAEEVLKPLRKECRNLRGGLGLSTR
jgi:hypothetical protein